MPALNVENPGVASVSTFGALLLDLLGEASAAKQVTTIEPALNKSDFHDLYNRVLSSLSRNGSHGPARDAPPAETLKARQFAVVETAARDLFGKLIATTVIDSPDFVKMWNLLDILSILSDDGLCDPALLFWLVEELLDSQTIAGCRKIFDFLESRRERITAKHFKQKNLVILRSCNELLRRLSRAEDTAFCGRVFIFMFQSFPLGDRSSVNLRGEYHVENVTSYELPSEEDDASKMEVDRQPNIPREAETRGSQPPKGASTASTPAPQAKPLDPDALYPLFWSLQESFSQPLKLFDPDHFAKFRSNLDSTMKAFRILQDDASQSSRSMENLRRTLKRRREDGPTEAQPEAFNPKYLTSKDLFQLEISDLSFRRHVLVQALIITDFLLSLSAGERERITNINVSNKSVIYPDQLSEENTKWAADMKKSISEYLKKGFEGPYFFRMVETVLARDKNWVFWKMASCPPIQRDPVSPASFNEAKDAAQRMAASKRLRVTPMGAMPLDFLRGEDDDNSNSNSERGGGGGGGGSALESLKAPERHQLPALASFQRKIADDDFEIEMPTSGATRAAAVAGKASKSWRALRIASRSRLAAFDRIDDPKKIDIIFADRPADADANGDGDAAAEDADPPAAEESMPRSRDPLILCAPRPADARALAQALMARHRGVFAPVVRHTTRAAAAGEAGGRAFHFVAPQEFNQLRDSDRLVEYGTRDGADYGTSTKAIDAVAETGKVPIIELDLEAAQFAKDMDFQARYVLIGSESEGPKDLFNTIISNTDPETAVDDLADFIFERGGGGDTKPSGSDLNRDAAMQDVSTDTVGNTT
ncbi:THO complex subunit 1 [Escovopsis weberi]|uniref:THO complex subunit 1 n=1 Tax=Escovopsis weberi TaxID=150374 RepID=A0A0N0RT77_ESCWE|nr:THO complex subunit 1 [Escovopsis weberi]